MTEPDLQQRGQLEVGADWQSLARSAAHANRAVGEEDEILRELLVFLLDGMRYAIPVERVRDNRTLVSGARCADHDAVLQQRNRCSEILFSRDRIHALFDLEVAA